MTATHRSLQLAKVAALAAEDKIAEKVMAIDVSDQMPLTDIFVIASAPSERQVASIVDEVEDRLRELGCKPLRREGQREGRWVLIDFGDIIVHVQHEEERDYYALERLWKDCPEVDLSSVEPLPRPAQVSDETADQDDAEPDDAEPDDAEPDDAEPDDAELDDAEQDDAEPDDTEPDDTESEGSEDDRTTA